MLNDVLIALLIIGAVGLVSAVLLSLASKFLFVPENEKIKEVRAALPGVNCGACGYSGCDEYAKAVAEKGEKTNLCVPGADDVAACVAKIMGKAAEDVVEMMAVVHCNGTCDARNRVADYKGVPTCKGMSMSFGGNLSCTFGCLGCGDCANACPVSAIGIQNGVAFIKRDECIGCGLCVKTCPKNLIELVPQIYFTKVLCRNTEKGAVARKNCVNACIGCKKCEKECPTNAITVENNLASIDYDKCIDCGKCAEVCPTGCIHRL